MHLSEQLQVDSEPVGLAFDIPFSAEKLLVDFVHEQDPLLSSCSSNFFFLVDSPPGGAELPSFGHQGRYYILGWLCFERFAGVVVGRVLGVESVAGLGGSWREHGGSRGLLFIRVRILCF